MVILVERDIRDLDIHSSDLLQEKKNIGPDLLNGKTEKKKAGIEMPLTQLFRLQDAVWTVIYS